MACLEKEVKVLDIKKSNIIKKLKKLNATYIGEFDQKRYIYDFNPVDPNKWIRLRTNGKTTTLTIKEILRKDKIDGVNEYEVEVSNFEEMNYILNKLGYTSRNYQENKRISYRLNDVNIEIDSWPLIPTLMEIEGKSVSDVKDTLKQLEINDYTTLDILSIYKNIYNIDLLKYKELRFDEDMLEHN